LDKIIEAMGFKRQDVYIAISSNAVPRKTATPAGRDETCIPYLEEQIRLIKPQFLVCLGRIAAHGLLIRRRLWANSADNGMDFRRTR